MSPEGTAADSHPVDLVTSLRQAAQQKDPRAARQYLQLLLDQFTAPEHRASARTLLKNLDSLESTQRKDGLALAQSDELFERVTMAASWSTASAPEVSRTPVLQMQKVSRGFRGSLFVLRDVSLEVRRGDLVGVVGMNGSGKSTLLRIAAGRQREDAGRVSYPGITEEFPKTPLLAKVAYVPQEPEPWSGRLREHLSLTLAFHGFTGKRNDAKVEKVLAEFEIGHLADREWAAISGGWRARCAFALALAPEPQLVIMDEPMASLDPTTRRWTLDKLQRLTKDPSSPVGALVSSHIVVEMESVATTMHVLEEGKLLGPEQLKEGGKLIIDLATDQPWRATEALQKSLRLKPNEVCIETRPDGRQVRITVPGSTGRGAILRALYDQGITPSRFVDLSGSAARKL